MFQIYFPAVLYSVNSTATIFILPIPYSRFVLRTVSGRSGAALGSGRTFTFNDGTNSIGVFTFAASTSIGGAGTYAANSSYGSKVITAGYLKITQSSTATASHVGLIIEIDPGARTASDFS